MAVVLRSEDFVLYAVQASAWIPGEGLDPGQVLVRVINQWASDYDGIPISLPTGKGLPPDVPSVLLDSKDGTRRLEVARGRINLFWRKQNEATADSQNIASILADRLAAICEESQTTPGRLALVITRRANLPQPGRVLVEQFCKEQWLKGPMNSTHGFELHLHTVVSLESGINANSWTRIVTAKEGQSEYNQVVLQQDINTLAEDVEVHQFDRSGILSLVEAAHEAIEKSLSAFFPEEI